jgi:hypothetical protein
MGCPDKLNLHIVNSTRGHDIIADVRDALTLWKQNWKKVHKVEKSVKIVDVGSSITELFSFKFLISCCEQDLTSRWRSSAYSSRKLKILAIRLRALIIMFWPI